MFFKEYGEAEDYIKEVLKTIPSATTPKYKIYLLSEGWSFKITIGNFEVYPVSEDSADQKWLAICGRKGDDGGIIGGPWTTKTIHNHPCKAMMMEAEAARDFVDEHLALFSEIRKSSAGMLEFGGG